MTEWIRRHERSTALSAVLVAALVLVAMFAVRDDHAQASSDAPVLATVVTQRLTQTTTLSGTLQLTGSRTLTLPGIAGSTTGAGSDGSGGGGGGGGGAGSTAQDVASTSGGGSGGGRDNGSAGSSSCSSNGNGGSHTSTSVPSTPTTHFSPPTTAAPTTTTTPTSSTTTTTSGSSTTTTTTTVPTTTTTVPHHHPPTTTTTTPVTTPTTTPNNGGGGNGSCPGGGSGGGGFSGGGSGSGGSGSSGGAGGSNLTASGGANGGGATGPVKLITSLVPAGSVVSQGGVLWTVNGQPTVLFYGPQSLFRTLSSGVTDGADVQVLEQNLEALGFTDGGALVVDQHWTSATTAAVDEWQTALGLTATGSVAPSDVIVAVGPVRVATQRSEVGDQASAGKAMLDVTLSSVGVVVQAPLSGAGSVKVGQHLPLTLNGRVHTTGTVASIGTDVTQASSAATAMVDVSISLDTPAVATGIANGAPATATLVVATSALGPVVPVGALHASTTGKTVVTVVDGNGRQQDVEVTPGVWANAMVAVRGDLHAGQRVVVG